MGGLKTFGLTPLKQDELGEPPATDIAAVRTVISIALCAPHLPDRQPIALTRPEAVTFARLRQVL